MTLAAILQKAARLPNVARDGWRYPVLRIQAKGAQTAVEALTGLGFAAKQAEQAVDGVMAENGTSDTSTVLRKALATLGKKR